jgi:hypothetical protein
MMRRMLRAPGTRPRLARHTVRALFDVIDAHVGRDATAHWLWNGSGRPVIVVVQPRRPFEHRPLANALAAAWRAAAPSGPEATFILLRCDDLQARSLVGRTMIPLIR